MSGTPAGPSLFGAATLLMTGRGVAFAATFLTPVVLARTFSVEEFGTYKQLFLVFATIYPIAQCGVAESLFYFVPNARRMAGAYVANSMLLLVGAGLVAAALILTGTEALAGWLGNPSLARHLPLIAAFLFLMLASAGLEIAMTAREDFRRAALTYGIGDLLRAACLIGPALVYGRLDLVLAGAVAYAGLRLLFAVVYFRRTLGDMLRPSATLCARQLAYCVPFGFAIVLEVAQANYHQYAVARTFDAAAFAVYAVGCLQIPFVDLVATSAGSVMMVHLARARGTDHSDTALRVWRDTTRKLALLFFPMAAVLAVVARELIVTLFTERYEGSVSIFRISLLTIALSAFGTDAVLRAHAQTRFLVQLYAMKLVIVAVLVGPCLRAFGLPGAILATVAALAASKIVAMIRVARLLQCGGCVLPWRSLGGVASVAVAAMVIGFAVRWPLRGEPLMALIVSALATAAASCVLVVGLGLVSAGERTALRHWVRQTLGRTGVLATAEG